MTPPVSTSMLLETHPIAQPFAATDSLATILSTMKAMPLTEAQKHVNFQDSRGKTLLARLAEDTTFPEKVQLEWMAFLLASGADVNLGDNDNWTPLYRASDGNHLEAVKLLLENKADPNLQNKDKSTPLHRAVDRNSMETVDVLLSNNANPNSINCMGTPLCYAAKNGNILIAKALVAAGADVNLTDDPLKSTPLDFALNNNKSDMASYLQSIGAQVVPPDAHPAHTFLSNLALTGNKEEIISSFRLKEKDAFGRSVAHYCAAFGNTEFLEKMKKLADSDQESFPMFNDLMQLVGFKQVAWNIDNGDNNNNTPLHYAIIKGQLSTVHYLINEGSCSLTSQDSQGYSSLEWACQYNREEIARQLVHLSPALLDLRDSFGWQPLHKAAQVGNLNLVKLFIEEYQVNPDTPTDNGRTALDLAKGTNSQDVVAYLNSLKTGIPLGVDKA